MEDGAGDDARDGVGDREMERDRNHERGLRRSNLDRRDFFEAMV